MSRLPWIRRSVYLRLGEQYVRSVHRVYTLSRTLDTITVLAEQWKNTDMTHCVHCTTRTLDGAEILHILQGTP